MSQADFPIGRSSACIIGQFKAGDRVLKVLFFSMMEGLGSLLVRRICTCCAVRVSAQPSCEDCHLFYEIVVGGHQGLVVDCNCRDCGRALYQNDFFGCCCCIYIVELIFKVVLVDKVFYCGALWGHNLA